MMPKISPFQIVDTEHTPKSPQVEPRLQQIPSYWQQ
uniref:Uncharacterized protein n=1 Tax=Arundo donax TaxID=35708 RepID=A0A0A9FDV7_ARUDO